MLNVNKKMIAKILREAALKWHPDFQDVNLKNCGHVMLYPQVKLAYNRIKKSANSSTTMFIADALDAGGYSQKTKPEKVHSNYHTHKQGSIDHGISLGQVWRPDTIAGLQSYYWITVVRNPYTRLLSAFLQRGTDKSLDQTRYRKFPGFDSRTPEGFSRFVNFLNEGGLHADKHWWPQHQLLFRPVTRYDYIAHTETLAEDLKKIFEKVGLRSQDKEKLAEPHAAEKSASWKVTNANSRTVEFYDDAIRKIVYELYKEDFKQFGYSYEELN